MEIKWTKQLGIFSQLLKKVIVCAYFLLIVLLLSTFQFLFRNEIFDITCPLTVVLWLSPAIATVHDHVVSYLLSTGFSE